MAAVLELTFKVFEATHNNFRYRFEVTGNDYNHTVILKRQPSKLTNWEDTRQTEVFDKESKTFMDSQLAEAMQFQSVREAINTISKGYL